MLKDLADFGPQPVLKVTFAYGSSVNARIAIQTEGPQFGEVPTPATSF